MSEERKKIIREFGCETIFTPEEESLSGCLKAMGQIVKDDPEKYYVVNQFINPLNPDVHYQHTAPEIWGAADCHSGDYSLKYLENRWLLSPSGDSQLNSDCEEKYASAKSIAEQIQ